MHPKPTTWTPADEGMIKVTLTDYNGEPYEVWRKPEKDYSKLWSKFRATMQQGIDYTNSIGGGGISMATEMQETLITIEQSQL